MTEKIMLNRGEFLKVSYTVGLGLLISIYLPGCAGEKTPGGTPTPTPAPLPTLEGPDAVS